MQCDPVGQNRQIGKDQVFLCTKERLLGIQNYKITDEPPLVATLGNPLRRPRLFKEMQNPFPSLQLLLPGQQRSFHFKEGSEDRFRVIGNTLHISSLCHLLSRFKFSGIKQGLSDS